MDSLISNFEIAGNAKRTYELNATKELKKYALQQERLSEFDIKNQKRFQMFLAMDFKSRDSVLRSEYDDNIRFVNSYASKNDFSKDQKQILEKTMFYQYKNSHFFFNKRKPEQVGPENAYAAYSKEFTGKTKDYLLYNLIKLGGMFNKTKPNPKLARQFQTDAESTLLKDYIKEMYDFLETKKSAAGQLANAAGETISWEKLLETHRGKAMYVDFWASWCGPCRAEVPASKLLKKKFSGKDVVFITISLDENNAAWKKASEKDGINTADNYILIQPGKSDLRKQYQITSIPRYFLVNKSGKVVNANAARPSDSEIVDEMNRLL